MFKQTMIEANLWGAFQEDLNLISVVNHIDFVLMKQNCEEVRGFRKFGRSTSLLRNCRTPPKSKDWADQSI
jgi:hypothetical protein